MNKQSEIEALINELKIKCPNVVISQLTNFGEKPFEFGVWKFWLETHEKNHIHIEVQRGECFAVYASVDFKNKYPITASKICNFLNEINATKLD
jgi:hypothetical protein